MKTLQLLCFCEKQNETAYDAEIAGMVSKKCKPLVHIAELSGDLKISWSATKGKCQLALYLHVKVGIEPFITHPFMSFR